MTTRTTMTDQDVIDQLNDLIENCKDGEYGFRSCAEHAHSAELKQLLERRAAECDDAARELQQEVSRRGAAPADRGTASGAVHRGWVAVRSALSTSSDVALLSECERGEDVALKRYRDALEWPLPPQVRGLVERQYEGVRRHHDEIRALRERYRAAAT